MRNKQAEIAKLLTSKQLKQQAWLSQLFIGVIALALSWLLFDHIDEMGALFYWSTFQLLAWGIGSALVIVLLEILVTYTMPKSWGDDGGINEKLFREGSYFEIVVLCMFVAVIEEWLFRGVLQTHFGLAAASVIFALVHIRYLSKIALFIRVLGLSLWIGFIYWWTDNLLVVIVLHFIVNVIQACMIRSGRLVS
ncbi:CPBP family intramembrane glutamic endopeptidase [Gracilibacillus alcaliphilus]|uniref:CPBP family intramembrane glutamic endopeptidase n=1 Tax=Gracilibacillus alcaliphilus TaxID=1401441 RepID=UPI00195D723C|nr:CPBP family intramembrane glutamic endopeptidase [Gracilibacillus alcaliphilus]MBM7675162.1 membrane protease YdiL (CAAX protease family) [Gracilibacillus alcaliphilus]